jgi:hypothetical protein
MVPRNTLKRDVTLRTLESTAARLKNWGKWGPDDELGTLNYVKPADLIKAAALVRRGKAFSLGLDFNQNGPQRTGWGDRFNPSTPCSRSAPMRWRDGRKRGSCVTPTTWSPCRCSAARNGTGWATFSTAICCDTWGCEVRPNESTEAFQPWHWIVIPMIGITMGEIFYLKDLGADCAQDKVYEFLFCAPTLSITGAVGSPTNPIALK